MTLTKVTGKEIYGFCRNSPYYQMVVENINREIDAQEEVDQKKKNDIEKIKNTCNSFSNDICSLDNPSAKEICEKFFCMYRFLNEAYREQYPDSILTYEDFDFLNYWLNVKLKGKNSNTSVCINKFDNEIGNKFEFFNTNKTKLGKHLHVIESGNLENMELLCELYNNERIILNMMRGQYYPDEGKTNEKTLEENKCKGKEIEENKCEEKESEEKESIEKESEEKGSEENPSEVKEKEKQKTCLDYTEDCSTKYKKAMDNCLNDNTDFYKALKDFKISYNYVVEREPIDLMKCKYSPYFYLPKYDPVVERQRNIMAGKFLSVPLILSFVIPLLYKYTPFGPFLRTKINMVRGRWMNQDKNENELLSLYTDIEDNISDNGEYNIGYYSETN
ncbi:PIR Superfamily Protein [Plasmodium ovale curtisi]|uniref:PIR Superfamily Protein n=1 Tax=Plasmodium ovale curtisi TaxID=864141 RepID=A0A1A8WHD9_PLAOA|nr:PIR Superfamily Protein [Plasmodium ovale curtisi]